MHVSSPAAFVLVLVGCAAACGGGSPAAPASPSQYVGACASASQSPYVLPYPVGTSYTVYQGYPPFNHSPSFMYAVDFSMPNRSTVVAAREGVVEYVQESYADNDYTDGHENVVTVDHGDGTYGRYVHLVKNGALVERGDRLSRGQAVGLSGATGSGVLHLHFDVTKNCSERPCQTVPVCFSNTRPHPDGVQRGQSYQAEPY